ncbi:hypothetical protein PV726_36660 [Streptomyces europaeiscabiei]|uniref:hypothetical protein n=1 Tax=Streptomyces europaeiscabiei TaxID=146819 RepID=UPI0029B56DC9|nr:hypothetical protein [Streptomyces europaeiscabiei]MDX3695754.1 hypothetical protein [Streptomyces europaeiscabiei]
MRGPTDKYAAGYCMKDAVAVDKFGTGLLAAGSDMGGLRHRAATPAASRQPCGAPIRREARPSLCR